MPSFDIEIPDPVITTRVEGEGYAWDQRETWDVEILIGGVVVDTYKYLEEYSDAPDADERKRVYYETDAESDALARFGEKMKKLLASVV